VTKTLDFIGVGGLSYDLVLRVDRLPSSDDKISGTLVGKLPGGFIANATCAAARLGLSSGYLGWIGDDADGEMLADEFSRYTIDIAGLVKIPGEVTPFTVILLNGQGERAIVIPASALYHQPVTDAQLAFAARANIVLTYPRDGQWCRALSEAAHADGGIFALDIESTSPMSGEGLRDVLAIVDVVFVSENSLSLMGATSLEELERPQWVIMTAGRRGAFGIERDVRRLIRQPAFPVHVVDTTGAGDCFHAGVLAAKHWGASLPEALLFASAAAAIKVQNEGARGGLPTRTEVEALLSKGA